MDLIGYALYDEVKKDGSGQDYVDVTPCLRLTKVTESDGMTAIRLNIVQSNNRVLRGPQVRKEDLGAVVQTMIDLLS